MSVSLPDDNDDQSGASTSFEEDVTENEDISSDDEDNDDDVNNNESSEEDDVELTSTSDDDDDDKNDGDSVSSVQEGVRILEGGKPSSWLKKNDQSSNNDDDDDDDQSMDDDDISTTKNDSLNFRVELHPTYSEEEEEDDDTTEDEDNSSDEAEPTVEQQQQQSVKPVEQLHDIPVVTSAVVIGNASTPHSDDDDEKDDAVVTAVEVTSSSHQLPMAEAVVMMEGKRKRTKTKIYADEQMIVSTVSSPTKKHDKKKITTITTTTKIKENKRLYKQEQANARRKLKAAQEARQLLQTSVRQLPTKIQGILVRNLGVIHVENNVTTTQHEVDNNNHNNRYSTARMIHPIGYSADWFVFSPIHNRIIPCRCDILRGKKGPLFRIQWGNIIPTAEDSTKPFLLDHATPVLLSSASSTYSNEQPQPGMGVKVRFDENDWYNGIILDVVKKPTTAVLKIQYEDGSVEEEAYPAEGIVLIQEKVEEEDDDDDTTFPIPHKDENVYTAYGNSPLEAWGRILVTFGLIDEITLDKALNNLIMEREKRLSEAELRLKNLQIQRKQAKMRHKMKMRKLEKEEETEENNATTTANTTNAAKEESEGTTTHAEPFSTTEEDLLRTKLNALRKTYETLKAEAFDAKDKLSKARLDYLEGEEGSTFSNPLVGATLKQQENWLQAVFRKEKSKMGSTGNKRKIMNSADLLNRMDTFFNNEIESLIEGLPGSELCPNYVFKACRGAAGTTSSTVQAWVQEAHIKAEKERDRQRKLAKEIKIKESQEHVKQKKRKAREEVLEQRKQQKLEEEQEKKKARQEERLARLALQVEDRLFKEACFQREKVVAAAQRAVAKEYVRRRNAAEKLASYKVEQRQGEEGREDNLCRLHEFSHSLPPLSKTYHRDVLRVWDFTQTFQSAFGADVQLPSLDEIQNAVNSLLQQEDDEVTVSETNLELLSEKRRDGVKLLTKIAVTLCKPLANGVIKTLSSAVAPPSGSTATSTSNNNPMDPEVLVEESNATSEQMEILVNDISWREVARLAILADALTEGLMFGKADCANILRGYRTGGHPNSKEAQRLRRGEDASIGKLRQILHERPSDLFPGVDMNAVGSESEIKVLIQLPSTPSAVPSTDWTFFLHNIRALPANATGSVCAIKDNLKKGLAMFQASPHNATCKIKEKDRDDIISDFHKCLKLLEQTGENESDVCSKARKMSLKILERVTGEIYSKSKAGQPFYKKIPENQSLLQTNDKIEFLWKPVVQKATRLRMGMIDSFLISSLAYKKAVTEREDYMAAALKGQLRREQLASRKQGEERGEDDEDDEEASDDEEDEEAKTETESQLDEESGDDNAKKLSIRDIQSAKDDPNKIGKATPFDEFCGDDSTFPELIRRCLAVLRTLCMSPPGETFIYPVDPQANPRYYETVSRPMCLQDIGEMLRKAGKRLSAGSSMHADPDEEDVVAEFARDVRLISDNCVCYSAIGSALVSHSEQLVRIFERLLLDWVLCPPPLLLPLEDLDDDRCVNHHSSDKDSLILICDGCEGKYNMSRLEPPLLSVPKGDWFCKYCINGRCWAHLDQRLGCKIRNKFPGSDITYVATVTSVLSIFPENGEGKATLGYVVKYDANADQEVWSLEQVDEALKAEGIATIPVKCVEAIAESPGYGTGRDYGIGEIIPVFLHPNVSDAAAQAMTTSTVFKDSVKGAAILSLVSTPEEMVAEEWLHILTLLAMKCTLTDEVQEVVNKLENEAAERLAILLNSSKVKTVEEILPRCFDDVDELVEAVTNIDQVALTVKLDENEEQPSLCDNTSQDKERRRKIVLFGDEDSTDEEIDFPPSKPSPVELSNSDSKMAKCKKNSEQRLTSAGDGASSLSDGRANLSAQSEIEARAPELETELFPAPDDVPSDVALWKKQRCAALSLSVARSKARDDAYNGLAIKVQLKPTVESFEEDTFSPVVDALLSTHSDGVKLDCCLCPGVTCDFCGLSDTALGSLLLRFPNRREWTEMMAHCTCSRVSRLIAEVPCTPYQNDSKNSVKNAAAATTFLSVAIRIDGKIVSDDEDQSAFEDLPAYGMLELLPRNKQGAQDELRFRLANKLPHISGSLSAHECCAAAAHNSLKEMLQKSYRDRKEGVAERDFARLCGKTLPLGVDFMGRSYWNFRGEPQSLFICDVANDDSENPPSWHRYDEPEAVASVIACLGKDDLAEELMHLYPKSARLVANGTWRDLLMKLAFPSLNTGDPDAEDQKSLTDSQPDIINSDVTKSEAMEDVVPTDDIPYEEGEDILVESKSGNLLWDASVIAVSKDKATDKVNSYRIHYKLWSTRFDEWVSPDRVVEPSNHNIEVQEELLEEWMAFKEGVPEALDYLVARNYLHSKRRARKSSRLVNLYKAVSVGPRATEEEKSIANLKGALLTIEAALPQGSVDTSCSGAWNPDSAFYWKRMVENSPGLATLMGCVILLEDSIDKAWFKPHAKHFVDCLPKYWKAISDASIPAIATRISLLDRAINYVSTGSRTSGNSGSGSKSRKPR